MPPAPAACVDEDEVVEAVAAPPLPEREDDPEIALARCCAYALSPSRRSVPALLRRARHGFRLRHLLLRGSAASPAPAVDLTRGIWLTVLPGRSEHHPLEAVWAHHPLEAAWWGGTERSTAFVHALRRLAELATLLATSALEYRQLRARVLDFIGHPVAQVDGGGRILAVNDAWRRAPMAELSPPGVDLHLGQDYTLALDRSGDVANRALAASIRRVKRGEAREGRYEYERRSESFHRCVAVDIIGVVGGVGALLVHRDLTPLRPHLIAGARARQARSEAMEQARQRIARDLHDDIVQRLAVTALALDQVHPGSQSAVTRVERLRAGLRDIIADLRSLSHRILPPSLRYHGLKRALHELSKAVGEAYGLAISTVIDSVDPISDDVALTLYRIAEEALANVAKHSGASRVSVTLRAGQGRLRLTISDDGRGMSQAARRKGIGIHSMRDRIDHVGGFLSIGSGPFGTQVVAVCPAVSGAGRTHARP
jgi:signal transduction histidine kinase